MSSRIFLFLASIAAATALRAQQPADTTPRTALVVSGGVSLGSYQAGATWAFIYALRNHDVLERARRGYAPLAPYPTPPRFILDVLAGASAGNVNAVLAAVDYCATVSSRDPETSLLWKFWLTVGWSALVQDRVKDPDLSAFTRSAAAPIWSSLDSTLRTQPRNPECDLLLGITTTKLTPHLVHVGPGIDVPIQRFAGVFRLVADSVGLAFAEPRASDVASRDLSDILILDPETDANRVPRRRANRARDYALGLDAVKQIVEASGSFPLAFAPRTIAYRTLDTLRWSDKRPAMPCLTTQAIPERCVPADRALFVDGGVFDNRPLGLALALAHGVEGAGTRAGETVPRRLLYFVDEDARRLDTAEARTATTPKPEPRAGVAAAIRVFSGAVNTGYNSELREFARLIEREPGRRVSLGVTTRNPRLMAEHFAHFGAFLARSFREHDFYAGVYDGLRSAFRYLYCGSEVGSADSSVVGMPCEVAWLRLVLDENLVSLQPAGRAVVDRLLYHETRGTPPALPAGAGFRGRSLVALVDANVDARRPGSRCVARGSFINAPLCTEQFLTVIGAWEDSLEKIHGWKRELCKTDDRYSDDCRVVDDPEAVYHGVVLRLLARMRLAEVELKRIDGRGWPGPVGVPLFYERAYNESFRSCFQAHNLGCLDLNPTSSDVMGGWWYRWSSRLLPITGAAKRDGTAHWLEWRPTAYLVRVSGTSISASVPLELMREKGSTFGAAGATVTIIPPVQLFSSVSASRIWAQGRASTDVTVALVSGTVRIGLRDDASGFGDFASLGNLTFGIGDANGLGARLAGWIGSVVARR